MMNKFLILLLSILFFSCQQKEKEHISTKISDPIVTKKTKGINVQVGDTILMNFKNKNDLFVAEGMLDSIHSRIYVKFKNEDLAQLNANIIPATGKGNIRFNQIIFPDKTSDGPFGIDLKISLKQKGDYIIVIGHSLMADNPYLGKFKVQLKIMKD